MPPAAAKDLSHFAMELLPVVILAPGSEGECTTPAPTALGGPPDAADRCHPDAPSAAVPRPRIIAGRGRVPQCPTVEATGPHGSRFAGNLLQGIVTYRNLRARQMGGETLPAADEARLAGLDTQLRPEAVSTRDDGRATRQFLRWETNAIAGVSLRSCEGQSKGKGVPVDLVDLGAGGVCIMTELTMLAGDRVELIVQGVGDDADRRVRLPSRVAWANGRRVGLMFAGGPQWD